MSYSWQGGSGRWYQFEVAKAKRNWDPVGGVYMFVKPSDSPTGEWGGPICLFLGSTDSLAAALERHNYWAAANQLGAAEVHILPIHDEALRRQVEADLLDAQRPILNRPQMKRAA